MRLVLDVPAMVLERRNPRDDVSRWNFGDEVAAKVGKTTYDHYSERNNMILLWPRHETIVETLMCMSRGKGSGLHN